MEKEYMKRWKAGGLEEKATEAEVVRSLRGSYHNVETVLESMQIGRYVNCMYCHVKRIK